jgi:hypothetical protein
MHITLHIDISGRPKVAPETVIFDALLVMEFSVAKMLAKSHFA